MPNQQSCYWPIKSAKWALTVLLSNLCSCLILAMKNQFGIQKEMVPTFEQSPPFKFTSFVPFQTPQWFFLPTSLLFSLLDRVTELISVCLTWHFSW